jgi:hypothetical protein
MLCIWNPSEVLSGDVLGMRVFGKIKPKSTKQHPFRLFQNPKRIDNAMDPKPIKNQWFCGRLFDFFDLIENCEYV